MNTYLIVSSFLNFSASLMLLVLVSWGRKSNLVWRKFFFFLVTVSGWSGSYYYWQISYRENWAVFFCQTLTLFSIFIAITLFDFCSEFSGIKKPKSVKVGYTSATFIAALVPFGLIIDGVSSKYGHQFWPNAGILMPLYLAYFTIYVLLSGAVLLQGQKKHVGRRATDQLFVTFTLLIGFIGGITNFPLWYDVPLQPYGNIFVAVYILTMGYGILNRRITGISAEMYKSLAALLLSFSVALLYILVITLYHALAKAPLSGLDIAIHAAGAFSLSVFAFWSIPRMKFHMERIIDGVFRVDESNSLKHLQTLPTRLSELIEEERIIQIAGESIIENTDASCIAILTSQPFTNHFKCDYSATKLDHNLSDFILPTESPLIKHLSERPLCILYDEVYGDLKDPFYQALISLNKELGISLIVPLFANHKIHGVILLGEPTTNEPWSDEQVAALFNIGSQIGLGMQARDFERRSNEVDKLIALGTMAAGLAHEIRNPLVSVQTLASLLNKGRTIDNMPESFKSVLLRDVQRIENIVEGVALFSRNQKGKLRSIPVTETILEAINITQPTLSEKGIELDLRIRPLKDTIVQADFDQLVQVFQNLIENSAQAMDGVAAPKLTILGTRKSNPGHVDQEWLELIFSDNGSGIPAGIIDRIFDPFVTSKDTGNRRDKSGMGLGLAISKRIVESHAGSITVENLKDAGACFTVSLRADDTVDKTTTGIKV